jgi:O-antigen ligase
MSVSNWGGKAVRIKSQPAKVQGIPTRHRGNLLPLVRRVDFLRIVLGALIVMVISRVHQIFPVLAPFRPALLLTFAALGYAVLRPNALVHENVTTYWWTRWMLAVVLQAMLSIPFGISMGNSGKFFLLAYSTVLILAGLVVLATRNTTDLVALILAFCVGVAALSFQTNFMFKLSTGAGLSRLGNLFTFDANDVGLIFVTAVPLVVALVPVWKGQKRLLLLLLLVSIGVGIARSGSRGAFLALIVSGAMMFLFNRGVAVGHRAVFFAAVVVALAVAAPSGYFDQMLSISNPTTDYNWTSPYGRREIAKRGVGYMLAYPLFGVGINNFQKAECTISARAQVQAFEDGLMKCAPPHNTWVQVGAELGFPGLVMWVVLLCLPLAKLFRLSRQLPLSWRAGDLEQRFLFACASALPVSLVGYMVASTFLTFAWLDLPYLLVIFAGFTWLFAQRRLTRDLGGVQEMMRSSPSRRTILR